MGIPPVRVDILMGIPGLQFGEAWVRRVEVDFDGLSVFFISRQDLIPRNWLRVARKTCLMPICCLGLAKPKSLNYSTGPWQTTEDTKHTEGKAQGNFPCGLCIPWLFVGVVKA
jgi:hypothetical protein